MGAMYFYFKYVAVVWFLFHFKFTMVDLNLISPKDAYLYYVYVSDLTYYLNHRIWSHLNKQFALQMTIISNLPSTKASFQYLKGADFLYKRFPLSLTHNDAVSSSSPAIDHQLASWWSSLDSSLNIIPANYIWWDLSFSLVLTNPNRIKSDWPTNYTMV